jgi:hypothetical protein
VPIQAWIPRYVDPQEPAACYNKAVLLKRTLGTSRFRPARVSLKSPRPLRERARVRGKKANPLFYKPLIPAFSRRGRRSNPFSDTLLRRNERERRLRQVSAPSTKLPLLNNCSFDNCSLRCSTTVRPVHMRCSTCVHPCTCAHTPYVPVGMSVFGLT